MPGLHLDFSDEDYALIPGKKRTWCKEVLLRELRKDLPSIKADKVIPVKESWPERDANYAFKTVDGEFLNGPGLGPADAWARLGKSIASFTQVEKYALMTEAVAAGWWQVDMFGV